MRRSDAALSVTNPEPGEMVFQGKVDIGLGGTAAGLDVGEGGSYSTGVEVFQYDSGAVSGSRFATKGIDSQVTTLGDAGDRLYIGSPNVWWAVRFLVGVASSNELPLIAKFWNGSSLEIMDWAGYDKDSSVSLNQDVLLVPTNKEYLEFDKRIVSTWATADDVTDEIPDGAAALYWICLEVPAGDYATPFRFDEVRVRGQDIDITSGSPSFFRQWGRSRVTKNIRKVAAALKRQGSGTPAIADVAMTTTIDSAMQQFADNATERLPLDVEIPDDFDPACGIGVTIEHTSASPGDIVTEFEWFLASSGVTLGGVAGTVIDTTITVGTDLMEIDAIGVAADRISIPAAVPGDILSFEIRRIGGDAADTTSDTWELLALTFDYVSNKLGEPV